jgi:hypothetical protein
MTTTPNDPGANWCPDCGLPRGVCDCDNHKRFATDEFDDWGLFDVDPFDYGDDDELDDYDYTEGDIGQDGEI